MKKPDIYLFLLLFVLMAVCPGLKSQSLFVNAGGERVEACTDRTMYVSGEKIHFSAVVYNINENFSEEFSRIIYCELITPDGKEITGRKYLLQNSFGKGSLAIPEETISGIYFLKFYTRFMRNISADEYKYIMVKIINPTKTEVLSGNEAFDTAYLPEKKKEVLAGNQSLSILSGKKTFAPGEEIRLNVAVNTGKGLPSRLCLSVVPESTCESPFYPVKKKQNNADSGAYLPETRGITISGKLIEKASGKPVPDTKINLSIIGDKDILVVRTDSSGRFFFALPGYFGKKDIFLSADDLPDITPEILIDNDFCSRPVNLMAPRFTLTDEEMKAAYKLAVNSRVASVFREDPTPGDSAVEENTSFYGEPSEVLVVDKYIDLPSLDEYFTELPGMLRLRKVQGRKEFRFYTNQVEMSMYSPLMLVDWVAVNDINKILAMPPLDIQRIELVNSPYVKGSITYGGIISFVSKRNDFAGIDLPKSGTFVNYRFLEKDNETITMRPSPGNIPDPRNTVYWNPDIRPDGEGAAGITFTAPDTPGKYHILLREIGSTGTVVIAEEVMVVSGGSFRSNNR